MRHSAGGRRAGAGNARASHPCAHQSRIRHAVHMQNRAATIATPGPTHTASRTCTPRRAPTPLLISDDVSPPNLASLQARQVRASPCRLRSSCRPRPTNHPYRRRSSCHRRPCSHRHHPCQSRHRPCQSRRPCRHSPCPHSCRHPCRRSPCPRSCRRRSPRRTHLHRSHHGHPCSPSHHLFRSRCPSLHQTLQQCSLPESCLCGRRSPHHTSRHHPQRGSDRQRCCSCGQKGPHRRHPER
mmetsp:Transcript_61711/g.143588  ORF Transcript_61711/g.143588 Transcript_61711/m.143588 type:complete len:240 (-) Transcript_61711:145-864(-)